MAFSLIELYNSRPVNQISNFSDFAENSSLHSKLVRYYNELRNGAPNRTQRSKEYFVEGHNGIPNSGDYSNRSEEHLALALFNGSRNGKEFKLMDGRKFEFLDYQFPLKARQGDKGISKVDLFCAIDSKVPAIVELKVSGKSGSLGDTPLRAILEGLAYCAIVETNMDAISQEASEKFKISFEAKKPDLVVMAPTDYWSGYLNKQAAGNWTQTLSALAGKISSSLDIKIHFLSLRNPSFEMGLNGNPPTLTGDCQINHVPKLSKGY